jgi:transcription initiation factor IIF auxiliary subunit
LSALRETGPVPGDENGSKNKRSAVGEESAKKKKSRTEKNVRDCQCRLFLTLLITHQLTRSSQVDMDKLADGLQKLNEDDLLQVVQMVHDNKAPDSYTKNDMERESPPLPFPPPFPPNLCIC